MTLNACITQSPAVIAFVVAIAGMMFPAISASDLSLKSGDRAVALTLDVELGSWLYPKDN